MHINTHELSRINSLGGEERRAREKTAAVAYDLIIFSRYRVSRDYECFTSGKILNTDYAVRPGFCVFIRQSHKRKGNRRGKKNERSEHEKMKFSSSMKHVVSDDDDDDGMHIYVYTKEGR